MKTHKGPIASFRVSCMPMKGVNSKKLLHNKMVIEEINRHKWLESELAGYDIGFEAAAKDWIKNHAEAWVAYHANKKLISLLTRRQGLIKSVIPKKMYS